MAKNAICQKKGRSHGIALTAEIAVGTFYLYFEDKQDVLAAIARTNEQRTADFLRETEALEDPNAAILHLFETSIDMSSGPEAEEAIRLELQLWAHAAIEPEFAGLIRKSLQLWQGTLARLARRARDAGLIGDQNSADTARILMALLNGYFLLEVLDPSSPRRRKSVHQRLLDSVRTLLTS